MARLGPTLAQLSALGRGQSLRPMPIRPRTPTPTPIARTVPILHLRPLTTSPSPTSTSTPTPTPTPKVKRPSPYRLPTLPAFLAAFAPLHAAGWRLDVLPAQEGGASSSSHSAAEDMISGADLQRRRLVRAYTFAADRAGWRAAMDLMAKIGTEVEDTDHHPLIIAAPASDVPPDVAEMLPHRSGYVLYVATHTHTPMPPLKEGVVFQGKPRPGVTGKDLDLAARIEAAFEAYGGRGE